MRHLYRFLAIAVVVLVAPALLAESAHPFSVYDMVGMDRVSDVQVSPDGKLAVFVVRVTDLKANMGRTDLWLMRTDGTNLVQLTTNPAADSSPAWAPDSKTIYFLSSRSGSSQVWKISTTGGEAEQVTNFPLDVENLLVAPDGKHLGITMEVFVDAKTLQATADRLEAIAKDKATGRIYKRLFIRHWDTWNDGRRSHLFVINADGSGEPIDVTRGVDADIPSKPWGGVEEIAFTRDSRQIVYTACLAGREEPWSRNFDLFVVNADGTGTTRNLTKKNLAWDSSPAFSPDGKEMVYLAMSRPGYESDRFGIMLMSWPDGAVRPLAPKWDRSAGDLSWSEDGKTVYATADNLGQHSMFAIDVATGKVTTLVRDGFVTSPSTFGTGRGERIMYAHDDFGHPAEVWTARADGSEPRQLTHFDDAKVAAAKMGTYQQFSFKGWNGEKVYGYVVKPVDFDSAKKYPVAFLIHGGPQGSWENHFHYRWNPQAEAGRGYGVVMVDFHGSTGYGQAFTDSIRGDWGGKPLEDLKKGLAAALANNPWMDGTHVSALGASFGGYMINWIEGNWPNRFRCLVNHDGNLDERFAYFATDELWFPEWDHEGQPWTNPAGYEKQNPVNFVAKWKTPMLVIHGGHDYRIADAEGFSTFTVLQRRGIPSKLLFFPDESHWVQKPANSILWHKTVLDWLDQWTK